MHAAADRLEFAPPQPPGLLRAFVLAVIAHLLLVLALTYGLRWQRETPVIAAEAELWSKLPVEAAPKVEPAPPPPPAPPVVKATPLPDPQVQRDAEIALERERAKREAAERRQAELEKERDRKRKLEAQRKRDDELARKKQEKLEQQEQARLQAEARRKDDDRKKRLQQEQQEKKLAQQREENMKRMQGMAGTGAPGATGTEARASGPSASYAGRIASLIRANTNFVSTVPGNPAVEVEIRLAPDGTVVQQRILKSSGNRIRDEEVLRGIERLQRIPRDKDGAIYTPMILTVRQF